MLTEQEKVILNLISKGLSNKRIAEELSVSEHTVKSHKENIFKKLNVHNNVQAIVKFYCLNQFIK